MGNFASIPLQIQSPPPIDPTAQMGKMLQLKNIAQQGQMANVQLQEAQQDLQDRQLMSKYYLQAQGDPEKAKAAMIQGGVSAKGVMGFQQANLKIQQEMAGWDKTKLESARMRADGQAATYNALMQIRDPDGDPQKTLTMRGLKAPAMLADDVRNGFRSQADADDLLGHIAQNPAYLGDDFIAPMLAHNTTFLHSVQAAKDQQETKTSASTQAKNVAELPGVQADAAGKLRAENAQKLAAAFRRGGAQEYSNTINAMPHGDAQLFPAAGDPNLSEQSILKPAMTAEQVATMPKQQADTEGQNLKNLETGFTVAGMAVSNMKNQDDWDRFRNDPKLPANVRDALPTFFDPAAISNMGMTPEQKQTLAARVQEWNTRDKQRQQRLDQQQSVIDFNQSGSGPQSRYQDEQEYNTLIRTDLPNALALRDRLSTQLRMKDSDGKPAPQLYINEKGEVVKMSTMSTAEQQAAIADMNHRVGWLTDKIGKLYERKGELHNRHAVQPGATPPTSKVFPRSNLADYAQKNKMTPDKAEAALKQQGWTVQ